MQYRGHQVYRLCAANRSYLQVKYSATVTLADTGKDVPKVGVDGLLPTVLFRRVYISYADRFVILEPW